MSVYVLCDDDGLAVSASVALGLPDWNAPDGLGM